MNPQDLTSEALDAPQRETLAAAGRPEEWPAAATRAPDPLSADPMAVDAILSDPNDEGNAPD